MRHQCYQLDETTAVDGVITDSYSPTLKAEILTASDSGCQDFMSEASKSNSSVHSYTHFNEEDSSCIDDQSFNTNNRGNRFV
jgi:hypothetical protein